MNRQSNTRYLVMFFCIWSVVIFNQETATNSVAMAKSNSQAQQKQQSQTAQTTQPSQPQAQRQRQPSSLEQEGDRQMAMVNNINKWLKEWGLYVLGGIISLGVFLKGIKLMWGRGFFEPKRLSSKNTSHGSAHFAMRKDIKHLFRTIFKKPQIGEIFVGKYKGRFGISKKLYLNRDLAEKHTLVLGPSGSGKSRAIFIPNCILNEGTSFIATDPKSELWDYTSGRQANAIRFAPKEPDASQCFNFVAACKEYDVAERVAMAIVRSERAAATDSFWIDSEQSLLTAVIVHIANTKTPTPTHMYELLCSGSEKITQVLSNSTQPAARRESISFEELESKTKTGILQGIVSKIRWLENKDVRRFTSSDMKEFDFTILRKTPVQVYWCLSEDDVTALQKLTKIFFNLAMVSLKKLKVEKEKAVPVNLYFDEFANIGKLIDFDKDITLIRSKGMGVIAGLQSISQLVTIYGKSAADTIFANFGNKIVLHGLEEETAEKISRLIGSYTHEEVRGGRSERGGFFSSNPTRTESYSSHARRVLTADEIRRYDEKKLLMISTNLPVMKLTRYVLKEQPIAAKVNGCGIEIQVPTYERIRPIREDTNRRNPPLPDMPDGLEI